MKSIWFLVTTTLLALYAINMSPASAQDTTMFQNGMQKEMEPLNRQTRQFHRPPTHYPPPMFRGGGGELEMLACDILCPDETDVIPYRAPRPTKGSFIPIRG